MINLKHLGIALTLLISIQSAAEANPLFENSIVSNDIDFIVASDLTVPSTTTYLGVSRLEMPDKRNDILFDDAHRFLMTFEDGVSIELYGHIDFSSSTAVKKYVKALARPIGKLPRSMRDTLSHVVIHKGNETAFAEHLGHFWVMYSDNIATRVLNNDLEETVFHEAVHATLDHIYRGNDEWLNAQQADNAFVTRYAQDNPETEDFAESALFAKTLIQNPNRLPTDVQRWLINNIPHRLMFFSALFIELESL